jgi:hypothetical protein
MPDPGILFHEWQSCWQWPRLLMNTEDGHGQHHGPFVPLIPGRKRNDSVRTGMVASSAPTTTTTVTTRTSSPPFTVTGMAFVSKGIEVSLFQHCAGWPKPLDPLRPCTREDDDMSSPFSFFMAFISRRGRAGPQNSKRVTLAWSDT